ncbi:MAG: alpha/beta fold hydrolase [Pseudomonadota bacterium]
MENVHNLRAKTQARATVLALHGSASNGKQWRALSAILEDQARVIAPDLPGYGTATGDTSDRLATFVNLVLRINEPVHIVAHSFGGAAALRLAETLPGAVASVTLYDPLVVQNGVLPSELRSIQHRNRSAGPEALVEGFLTFWGGKGTWERLSAHQRERLTQHVPSLRRDFHEIESGLWDLDHGAFTGPITTLWGGNSPEPTREMARVLQSAYPHVRQNWLEGYGHLSPLSDAQNTAMQFVECLQQQLEHAEPSANAA